MFAIPGILGILFFMYLRPQEPFEQLRAIPFLYLFFALVMFGSAVDLRLRVTKAISTPALPWAAVFFLWAIITVSVKRSQEVMSQGMSLFITVAVFVLIAQSLQTFRVFEKVAVMIVALSLILGVFAVHQATSPKQCVIAPRGLAGDSADAARGAAGTPDGRPCEKEKPCYDGDVDPEDSFFCEKVGVLGTHSQAGRVRYNGILMDPNELAMTLAAGLSLLLGLWAIKRTRFWAFTGIFGIFIISWAVKETGSRSGQLGLLGALTIFALWKWGRKLLVLLVPMAPLALVAMAAGGGERGDAGESNADRFEAWRSGMDMLRESPIFGAGFGQYTEHSVLTAHNTFMLVVGELGMIGTYVYTMVVWISLKIPLVAIKRYEGHTEARVGYIWAVAVLASMMPLLAGGIFISFSYHAVMWIFMALAGGLFICIRRHDPDFAVRISAIDLVVVGIVDVILYLLIAAFLKAKGF